MCSSHIQGDNFTKLLLLWRVDKHQCRWQWLFSCLLASVRAYIQNRFRCFDERQNVFLYKSPVHRDYLPCKAAGFESNNTVRSRENPSSQDLSYAPVSNQHEDSGLILWNQLPFKVRHMVYLITCQATFLFQTKSPRSTSQMVLYDKSRATQLKASSLLFLYLMSKPPQHHWSCFSWVKWLSLC